MITATPCLKIFKVKRASDNGLLFVSQALAQVAWIMALWEGKRLEQNPALSSGL